MRMLSLLVLAGIACGPKPTPSKIRTSDPIRVVTISDCRLTQPPPRQSITVRDAIEKRGRNLTDFEIEAVGDYLEAVVLYAKRAWRLCGTVTP